MTPICTVKLYTRMPMRILDTHAYTSHRYRPEQQDQWSPRVLKKWWKEVVDSCTMNHFPAGSSRLRLCTKKSQASLPVIHQALPACSQALVVLLLLLLVVVVVIEDYCHSSVGLL